MAGASAGAVRGADVAAVGGLNRFVDGGKVVASIEILRDYTLFVAVQSDLAFVIRLRFDGKLFCLKFAIYGGRSPTREIPSLILNHETIVQLQHSLEYSAMAVGFAGITI